MRRIKHLAALLLALALLTPAALAAPFFPPVGTMPVFTDLSPQGTPGSTWYDYPSIKTTVEAGLMKGTGAAFQPAGIITVAEVATIAARIHEKTGGVPLAIPAPGQPWYGPAMERMAGLGISAGAPEASASRSDFVRMLSAVLPQNMTVPINTITFLPDTKDSDVLRFYNAGFLMGKDIYGTFDGAGTILRTEVAAIVARIIDPALRKTFTPAYSPQGATPAPPSPLPAPPAADDKAVENAPQAPAEGSPAPQEIPDAES